VGLKLNGTHQLLAYADYVNQLGDNIDTVEKNTETLIDDSKEVDVSAEAVTAVAAKRSASSRSLLTFRRNLLPSSS
jgi:hypothetical protein